ncbi:cell wall hydrolase [Candidatus Poribacteria bacterium]|jgi:N-acetylmuramoyl-L-alanine amidase|nr:cell wall hydrolase [Candidatus Poribacteria bacterium]
MATVDRADVAILAALLAGEARGEPVAGQLAVAHVVMNRARLGGWWGDTIRGVALKRWQFSTFNPPGDDKWDAVAVIADRLAVAGDDQWAVAEAALSGVTADPTDGATHYYNPALADPSWAAQLAETVTIGAHRFMKAGT